MPPFCFFKNKIYIAYNKCLLLCLFRVKYNYLLKWGDMLKRLVVIGGGAAGTFAAISAAYELRNVSHSITIIEKNNRLARKVMITGKGRCNVTNNCDLETLIANTPRNGKFLYSAFSSFLPQDVMSFFESLKVPLKTERGNRVFPVSDKAVDIVDALAKSVKANGISVVEGRASEIIAENGSVIDALCNSFDRNDPVKCAQGWKSEIIKRDRYNNATFMSVRCVWCTPQHINECVAELQKLMPQRDIEVVDPFTYYRLLGESMSK